MTSLPPADPRSDETLIAAINRGEAKAFDALYFRYRDWVARLAHRFTGHEDDALDVLQETFSYLFRKFPGFALSAKMTTFLFPVVRNLSIAARRKRQRQMSDEGIAEPTARQIVPEQQVRSELAAALASLPETHREVVLMRFVDGMSLQEIAEALSIPEGTVKSRLHNALSALQQSPQVRTYFGREQG